MTIILKDQKFGDMDMMMNILFSLKGNIFKQHVCNQSHHVPKGESDPHSSKRNIYHIH